MQQIRALVNSGHGFADLDEPGTLPHYLISNLADAHSALLLPGLLQLTRKSVHETQISKAFYDAISQRESRTIEVLKSILALPPRATAPEPSDLQRTCQKLLSEVRMSYQYFKQFLT